jgi:hypothetical protein
MIESLDTMRRLRLAGVFEDLFFGRSVPADLQIYMSYPSRFHDTTLGDWQPLTDGGLIPIVDDGNFYDICFFDPNRRKFVLKFVEEPRTIVREFDSWQQFLAYKLLDIAESGPDEDTLVELADAVGFTHTRELLSVLREMKALADDDVEGRAEQFIRILA